MNSPLYALFTVVVDLASWLIFLRFIFGLAEVHKKNPYAAPIYRLSAGCIWAYFSQCGKRAGQ